MNEKNISGTFTGCQFGDYNTMVNNLSSDVDNKNEVQSLLHELRGAIEKSEVISKYSKIDMQDSLNRFVEALPKSDQKKDDEGVVYFWNKVVGAAKDIVPIFSILQTLGKFLGLPL